MPEPWKLHDKTFVKYMSERKIQAGVKKMASRLSLDYQGKKPLFIVVLNGSFIFASDLLKRVSIDCEIAFVKVSSYKGVNSTGKIEEVIGLDIPVEGRHVVLVEDIVDSGLTIVKLIDKIQAMKALDVRVATCLFKPKAFKMDFLIDYVCFRIPNDFVVGYGLDYDGLGRNSADIYRITEK
jgi:hypoxanthine phosphoribosyltransferase